MDRVTLKKLLLGVVLILFKEGRCKHWSPENGLMMRLFISFSNCCQLETNNCVWNILLLVIEHILVNPFSLLRFWMNIIQIRMDNMNTRMWHHGRKTYLEKIYSTLTKLFYQSIWAICIGLLLWFSWGRNGSKFLIALDQMELDTSILSFVIFKMNTKTRNKLHSQTSMVGNWSLRKRKHLVKEMVRVSMIDIICDILCCLLIIPPPFLFDLNDPLLYNSS